MTVRTRSGTPGDATTDFPQDLGALVESLRAIRLL